MSQQVTERKGSRKWVFGVTPEEYKKDESYLRVPGTYAGASSNTGVLKQSGLTAYVNSKDLQNIPITYYDYLVLPDGRRIDVRLVGTPRDVETYLQQNLNNNRAYEDGQIAAALNASVNPQTGRPFTSQEINSSIGLAARNILARATSYTKDTPTGQLPVAQGRPAEVKQVAPEFVQLVTGAKARVSTKPQGAGTVIKPTTARSVLGRGKSPLLRLAAVQDVVGHPERREWWLDVSKGPGGALKGNATASGQPRPGYSLIENKMYTVSPIKMAASSLIALQTALNQVAAEAAQQTRTEPEWGVAANNLAAAAARAAQMQGAPSLLSGGAVSSAAGGFARSQFAAPQGQVFQQQPASFAAPQGQVFQQPSAGAAFAPPVAQRNSPTQPGAAFMGAPPSAAFPAQNFGAAGVSLPGQFGSVP